MTQDEIILAQQARIERLNATLNKFLESHEECTDFDGFTAYIVSMDDFHDTQEEVGTKPDDLSALRAHDAEIAELVEALQYLAEAILTKADADYTRRQMDEAVRVMELHGITMPVPYALAKASKP